MSAALDAFLRLWNLEFERAPAPPGGREPYPGAGEVAFVRRGGLPLVLKLLPEGEDEWRSGEVLEHWNGEGAVRLIAQAPGAVLIERATPGDDLSALVQAGDDSAATDILCEVMARLNRPPPVAAFRSVTDWGHGFARNRPAALAAGMDPAIIDRGERLFHQLCETQGQPVVLHGDLHHYNVIRDSARGWLAIDPKGVLGEAAYEVGAMLRNPIANPELFADPAIVERRVRQICARLGYDYGRVIGWCFSQWVLSVLWAVESGLTFAPDWLIGPRAAETLL